MKLTKTAFKPNYYNIKNHISFFLVFVFSKVLSICELLLACLNKKCHSHVRNAPIGISLA